MPAWSMPMTLAVGARAVFDANGGFERAIRTAHAAASAAAVGLLSLAPAGGSASPLAALKTLQQVCTLSDRQHKTRQEVRG